MANFDSELISLREQIDSVDFELVKILEKRAALVKEVGRHKSLEQKQIYCPEREAEVLRRVQKASHDLFEPVMLENIFREIIGASRTLEKSLRISFLGPEGTYTQRAALLQFGRSAVYEGEISLPEVFQAVESGRSMFGIVPVENSLEGQVTETADLLFRTPLKVISEIYLEIHVNLLAKEKPFQRLFCHPQSLGQCRLYLNSHYPGLPVELTTSTSVAARKASEMPGGAALGSDAAAEVFGLKIWDQRVEDHQQNYTRFFVLAPASYSSGKATGKDTTSLLYVLKDKPKALFNSLVPFSDVDINLTRIESRPLRDRPWNYIFFLDMDGHRDSEAVAGAITRLEESAQYIKILGSYPSMRPDSKDRMREE